MQMVSICVCHTYADARHMDMLNLCCILSFPGQIRKKLFSDLRIVTLPRYPGKHNMWWIHQLLLLPDVVFFRGDR